MDIQFFGANCITVSNKGTRFVIDDNLVKLGAKSITKSDDVALYTHDHQPSTARLTFDKPGEYEVSELSITGIAARSHMDEPGKYSATIMKLTNNDQSILICGHIYPELSDEQLEDIGRIDILIVPVGGNGYTLDPVGALKIIKDIEPKIVIPTHYSDKALNFEVPQKSLDEALKELAMEPKESINKLKLKTTELTDVTQLIILEKS